ncbi:MAG: response regulator, partial [Verrucomicrobia bacterium]|nr:response regulator [Verrucomicrobiota bacterium]
MKKIMIVEDDAVITRIYERQFLLAGYNVEMAADGEAAVEKLKGLTPDLVMLDLQMPKKNGIEVLKFIRSQPATKDVPVVVFTNSYLGNMVQQAWQAGANKCLTKAICTPKQLLEVVRTTLAEMEKDPVAAPAKPAAEAETAKFEKEISTTFLVTGPQTIAMLRGRLQTLTKVEADPAAPNYQNQRITLVDEMCQIVHGLAGKAGLAGATRIG